MIPGKMKKTSIWKNAVKGSLTSLCGGIVLGAALAWLLQSGKVGENQQGYGVLIVTALSAFVGGVTAEAGEGRGIASALSGAFYFLVLCIGGLLAGGGMQGVLPTLAVIICGSFLGGLLQRPQKKRGKHRKFRTSTG